MKKIILPVIFSLIVSIGYCQKIKVNKIDKYTKERIIETSFEKIVSDGRLFQGIRKTLYAGFRYNNGNKFLRLKWTCEDVLSVEENAKIIFLDEQENPITFENYQYAVSEIGAGTPTVIGASEYGLSLYVVGDFEKLHNSKIKSLRIYTTDGYVDFEIKEKKAKKMERLYEIFKKEVEKSQK